MKRHFIFKSLKPKFFYLLTFLLLITYYLFPTTQSVHATSDYQVKSFHSQIKLNQDTSLTITETIQVNFSQPRHGIYRTIPIVYSGRGQTIKAGFKTLSVTNQQNKPVPFQKSRLSQSIQLKIGDPDHTITGDQTYIITYQISDIILKYDNQPELYWNVTGHQWDTDIKLPTATVISPFAQIIKAQCYTGLFKSQDQECSHTPISKTTNQIDFTSLVPSGNQSDFTIVVALAENNQLQFPGIIEQTAKKIFDNLGYVIALIPLSIITYRWYKYGRDYRYASDQIYYQPEETEQKLVSPFARPHLPLVYAPIQDLTPSQVGTIIDQKVDIHDIVAEIVELARLKYLKIEKIETRKIFGKSTDYAFIKTTTPLLSKEGPGVVGTETKTILTPYQQFLLDKLFSKKKTFPTLNQNLKT